MAKLYADSKEPYDGHGKETTTFCLSVKEERARKDHLFGKRRPWIDLKLRSLILKMNKISGVATTECCQGHVDGDYVFPPHLLFRLSHSMAGKFERRLHEAVGFDSFYLQKCWRKGRGELLYSSYELRHPTCRGLVREASALIAYLDNLTREDFLNA